MLTDILWFWMAAVKFAIKSIWDSLPGPWYVKLILIIITQAIPGPQDELLLFAIMALFRYIKKRRAARA